MVRISTHPEWALACKRKGTELRFLNGCYYLYEVTSKWNPEKKRSVKITGKLLGKITQTDGFIESDKNRLRKQMNRFEGIQVKEWGITSLIDHLFGEIITALKNIFPDCWQQLIALAYGRLVHQSPLKNMLFHYCGSFLSEQYPNLDLSSRSLSRLLKEIGQSRSKIVEFCRCFKIPDDCVLFDGTDIFSRSARMELPKFSKSKFGTYDDMINLMFIFSVNQQTPVYYRLLPGNIKDVSAFKLCLQESGVKDVTVVIDKGFASKQNIETLEKEELKFIIPLPRDNKLIDYRKIKSGDKRQFDGFFIYEERHIWHYNIEVDKKKSITVFLDEELRYREEKDFLNRIDNKVTNYTIEKYHDKQHTFGTLSMMKNTGKSAREVYTNYKLRGQVETMIDALKNILEADRTYMQNQTTLEGWMFVNLIALKWYYCLLNLLKKHELNKKYSPADFLAFLSEVKMVKINEIWQKAEVIKNTTDILKKLKIEHIT
jgi:hypothetical protein